MGLLCIQRNHEPHDRQAAIWRAVSRGWGNFKRKRKEAQIPGKPPSVLTSTQKKKNKTIVPFKFRTDEQTQSKPHVDLQGLLLAFDVLFFETRSYSVAQAGLAFVATPIPQLLKCQHT